MCKLKTKSGVKKRFRLKSSGLIVVAQSGKRHNMRKRTNKQIRNQRGIHHLNHVGQVRIKAFMPYG